MSALPKSGPNAPPHPHARTRRRPSRVPLLLVISAPSGGGKTTVCNELLATDPNLSRIVTCTTRQPREGERPDVDYFFLTAESFAAKLKAGQFLEHATVYGHAYGTLRQEVTAKLRSGRDVVLSVDVQGVANIRRVAARHPQLRRSLVTVFLAPPSLDALEARLRKRAKDNEATIRRRLRAARAEVRHWPQFDYVVVSETIGSDASRVRGIVESERLRAARRSKLAV